MADELYRKHRPAKLTDVLGQDDAVAMLTDFLAKDRVPHAVLFTGPSGCGKTTLARILCKRLKCADIDYREMNAANFRGIDMVRDVQNQIGLAPMGGRTRVWVIDEAHQLTKDAQNAFLKVLEDPPKHAYVVLCTTDPAKLIKTVISRCTEIKVSPVKDGVMEKLLAAVAEKECILPALHDDLIPRIVEVAEGSPRKALVLLHAVMHLPKDQQVDAVQKSDTKTQSIDLCRAMIKPGIKWPEVAKLLKDLEDEPESIRRMVLGYASSVVLGGGKLAGQAAKVLSCFRDHFYDCGKAGLVLACWEVVH